VQIIVESHSVHLLLRLQRRIAEEEVVHSDVKLYFCGLRDGSSTLEQLRIDMFGRIENWPDKFMGDAFGETYAAEERRIGRMTTAAE
jgi:predicted ATPase